MLFSYYIKSLLKRKEENKNIFSQVLESTKFVCYAFAKENKKLFSFVIQLPNTELSDTFLWERQTICLAAILSECCIICSSLLKAAASLNLNTIFQFKAQKEEHIYDTC